MKIRFDFVTNSSSTSFVIISKGWPERDVFLAAMGARKNSPLKSFFERLYEVLEAKAENAKYAITGRYWGPEKDVTTLIRKNLSENAAKRASQAIANGEDIWIGHLDSDEAMTEAFFCCESFEINETRLYINALCCAW